MFPTNLKGFVQLSALVIAIVSLVVPSFAAIPGVLMNEFSGGGWAGNRFVDESTGQDVTGTITVTAAANGTTIQVYDGSWTTMSSGSPATGSRVRVDGVASGVYQLGGGDIDIDIEIEDWD